MKCPRQPYTNEDSALHTRHFLAKYGVCLRVFKCTVCGYWHAEKRLEIGKYEAFVPDMRKADEEAKGNGADVRQASAEKGTRLPSASGGPASEATTRIHKPEKLREARRLRSSTQGRLGRTRVAARHPLKRNVRTVKHSKKAA